MGNLAVALSPRTLAMLRTSLTYAPQHDSKLQQLQQQHAGNAADGDVESPLSAPPDEQVPSAVLGVAAKGLDIRYDDDQPSFPDAANTHLRFSSGAAALHAQQLHGCKRAKVRGVQQSATAVFLEHQCCITRCRHFAVLSYHSINVDNPQP
jgi:hypothetical protein